MRAEPANFDGSVTIVGEKGLVRLGGLACNRIEAWEFADERPEDKSVAELAHDSHSVYGPGHTAFYTNVLQTLRVEAEPAVDGYEALRTLEVVVAAYRSASEHRPVALEG
jgi:UDP-N-acetyl-2-amino-2-deoxyglucuronate dehydrogenase